MIDPTDYPLTERDRLPDALRVLLEEYPREGWAADPGFQGLVAFWMDRHLMFRRLLEHLGAEAEAILDGEMDPQRFAAGLSRYGGMLVSQLHGHHQIEDQHYFPVLAQRDHRVARGFDILDADHHALDGLLAGYVEAANTVIGSLAEARDPKSQAAGYAETLTGLTGLLDRHLTDEEDLVVPVILKYGQQGLG